MEYINGTSEYGITFQRGTLSGISLEVFADADYASKATDRRSISGGLIMCGGASVCWFSRTQKCVTLSTSEAEYVALGDAVKELVIVFETGLAFYATQQDHAVLSGFRRQPRCCTTCAKPHHELKFEAH